ncbi:MAG: hypothetical protein VW397_04025 [Candidatus Margulisiibacteriota bacterium]
MKILGILLMLYVSVGIYANDTDQNRINNFLYGPYLNDPPVPIVSVDLNEIYRSNKCNKVALKTISDGFLAPGLWREDVGVDNQLNIAICAKQQVANAAVLLEKLVYASQNATLLNDENRLLKGVIYNSSYILDIANTNQRVFQAIPDSHPDYVRMIRQLLPKRPQLFNYITMRYKRDPWVTDTLFDVKQTYDDIYKHMAIQYTNSLQQRKRFVMHNGLLYLELPSEKRNNPYLAYHAFIQNDFVYPFIPKDILAVFDEDGTIMVPRYMTKLTMLKQNLSQGLGQLFAPFRESFQSDAIEDEVVLEIEDSPTGSVAESESLQKPVTFKNERTVVTDIRIINKIENKKKRRLLNLWRISRYGEDGQIFVAMFRPNGKENLGTIVVKQNERYMFSDYAAVFSMDGDSIWRIKDDGTFSSKTFSLDHVTKSDAGIWHFRFSWKGVYTTNQFDLVEEGGMLVKEFVNYYFE